jgi:hypothetical protein
MILAKKSDNSAFFNRLVTKSLLLKSEFKYENIEIGDLVDVYQVDIAKWFLATVHSKISSALVIHFIRKSYQIDCQLEQEEFDDFVAAPHSK